MRVYLDNCCYNRPFDEQTSLVVRLETEAKLRVQELIRLRKVELVWSFVLDYENSGNPFLEKRERIAFWKYLALFSVEMSDTIKEIAVGYAKLGFRQKDAAHVACAEYSKTDFFLTTDKKILNKPVTAVLLINPIDFVRRYSDDL
jgi:predicted nucleic acid-binding protein